MSPIEKKQAARRLRLKPADSFDLIRLLARSQSDPRKALAELVQNSLDAQARRIEITWFNERGARSLSVWDDGGGVFPELEREEALRRIAQTIGHSHKRHLTPEQRRELMALGKYGIGLLGFWCVGHTMRLKSRVAGSESFVLHLEEDRAEARIERCRARRIDETPTFTEVEIRGVHEGAARQLRPGRLQAYLASELRGQLLGREVEIHIYDRVARGTALKHFQVKPQRFLGQLLAEHVALAVPGHEDARVELYLVPAEEERTGRVQLACGGTTVLNDLALVDEEEGPRIPWDSGRLEGVIDFPELEVAPGTRRGFQRNAAALAFLDAMRALELQLAGLIAEDERARETERHQSLARELRRAFRRVAVALPQYDLFDVRAGASSKDTSPSSDGAAVGEPAPAPDAAVAEPETPREPTEEESPLLFPPGPLVRVRVQPGKLRVAPGASRTLRARALDADGRAAAGPIAWSWALEGAGELAHESAEAHYAAPGEAAQARILVRASKGEHLAEAVVEVSVLPELAGQERAAGIPEPKAVYAPSEGWRSRVRGNIWEFNEGHPDYLAVRATEARRFRYLAHLFAKEIVLRNFGMPEHGGLLERMVEVLTYLEPGRASAASEREDA